jgi:hypothetical protein
MLQRGDWLEDDKENRRYPNNIFCQTATDCNTLATDVGRTNSALSVQHSQFDSLEPRNPT